MIERRKKKENKKKEKLFKHFLFFVLPTILIVGLFYLIVVSQYFQIKNINFSGSQEIAVSDLEIFANSFLAGSGRLGKNLIFFNEEAFVGKLRQSFSGVKTAEIKRIWPGEIQVTITERKPEAIFCAVNLAGQPEEKKPVSSGDTAKNNNGARDGQQTTTDTVKPITSVKEQPLKDFWDKAIVRGCYFIDNEGITLKDAALILGGRYPGIMAEAGDLLLGKQVMTEELVSAAKEIQQGLTGLGLNPRKYFLFSRNKEMRVLINDQWTIIFDLGTDLNRQLSVLGRSLKEEIKERAVSLDYIDLRVEGRAYYRLR